MASGKVFVTGGTGHVGANLVRGLLARGEDVRALAREFYTDDRVVEGVVRGTATDRRAVPRS